MKLFLKRSKGSITVLVALMLVPAVFVTGFLVDISRLKLYGNQAVMTADNYGETVLSMYDNLLKELYGLFAVTQDEEAIQLLDDLQDYMKSSFDPSENTITWEYMEDIKKTSYEGFMPYRSAEVSLSYALVEEANLRNEEVFSTQIGDFMKFRVAQQLLDKGSAVLDAMEEVQNMEGNSKAISKDMELIEKAEDMFKAAEEYYNILTEFTRYPDYINGINSAYADCRKGIDEIANSDAYEHYFDYEKSDKDAMEAALEHENELNEPVPSTAPGASPAPAAEPLDENEKNLIKIYEDYMADEDAREDKLKTKFDAFLNKIEVSAAAEPLNFDNYDWKLAELQSAAAKVEKKGQELLEIKLQLDEILSTENVSEEVKNGIKQELENVDPLIDMLPVYGRIANYIKEQNEGVNSAYAERTKDILSLAEKVRDAYLDCEDTVPKWQEEDSLDESRWKDFLSAESSYKDLYESLRKCFEKDGTGSADMPNRKKEAAEGVSDRASTMLEEDETETTARDIPESFGYGISRENEGFDLTKMVGQFAEYSFVNSFADKVNELALKLYTVVYDFGMFSSRTTNIDPSKDAQEAEVSLTGYEKGRSINYLYQAELEYILGGSNSSKSNLDSARNKILAFRAVVNFVATYQIEPIDTTIKGISEAASAVNPLLGLVVNGALRLAVTGIETAMDWDDLKAGKEVIVIKTRMKHLNAYDSLLELFGEEFAGDNSDGVSAEKEPFRLDYNQYLLVMLVFMTSSEEIASRTADLIELNVNAVQQQVGDEGTLSELKFKMEDAHTAVTASCSVHLDFVVLPRRFAQLAAEEDAYNSLVELEERSHKFTVTRGY